MKFLFYQEKWHRIRENHLGERIFQELIRRIDNLEKMEANAVWHSKRFQNGGQWFANVLCGLEKKRKSMGKLNFKILD